MLLTLFYFMLALFLLVTIHEAGHFWVARRCGVQVLRFSFGFGPVLFSKRDKKGTEFAFSLIPLGGYVKFLGDSGEEVPLKARAYTLHSQPIFKRVAIILAGPLANFLLAFLIFWCVAMIGMLTLAPVVEDVLPQSLAESVGFVAQDEIKTMNGEPVRSWRDVRYALMPHMGGRGVLNVGVLSRADGLKRRLQVPLGNWATPSPETDPLQQLGIMPALPKMLPRIEEVFPNTPAMHAGLQVGDEIQAVDGQVVDDWRVLVTYVKHHPHQTIVLLVKRGALEKRVSVQLGAQTKAGKEEGMLGVLSGASTRANDLLYVQREGPMDALVTASKQTWLFTKATVVGIGRMLLGNVPLKNLSGPLGIAEGAGHSARGGLVYYLFFLALLSVGLGVLNLLPIPILDGGQLMYSLVEWITGRSLSERSKMLGVLLGLVVLMTLTVIALRNDVMRLTGS